ncbi:hypothetical protein [Thalassotalea sp. PS06]|uniref:hypothetical protein n=1 Tax=Thalassotalea sp. PS06 TaxID=2594005 RepID=UPI0011642610|nr:hypothetical protein [Thalassotalea sp. PS06]QDP00277.1 hypothetical protein FNC98_02280 [Thalassotalea sp. PS06]
MKLPIKLKPTKATIKNSILFTSLMINTLFFGALFYKVGNITDILNNGELLIVMFLVPFGISIVFVCVTLLSARAARVEIHEEGIVQNGLNKYGFKNLIPWGSILDASVFRFKSGRFLKLRVKYNRNVLSRNGSKAIDTASLLLSIQLSPYSDSEILEIIKLAKFGRY